MPYVQNTPVSGSLYHAQNMVLQARHGTTPRMNVGQAGQFKPMTGTNWQKPLSKTGTGQSPVTSMPRFR